MECLADIMRENEENSADLAERWRDTLDVDGKVGAERVCCYLSDRPLLTLCVVQLSEWCALLRDILVEGHFCEELEGSKAAIHGLLDSRTERLDKLSQPAATPAEASADSSSS